MGLDNAVITVIGVVTAAVAALVLGAAIAAAERARLTDRRRPHAPGAGPSR